MTDVMSTKKPHPDLWYCPTSVREHNRCLAAVLERRFHMSLLTYKTVKWLVYLAAMVVSGMAINEGADPLFTIIAVAFILGGPEVLEYIAVAEDYTEYRDRQQDDDKN